MHSKIPLYKKHHDVVTTGVNRNGKMNVTYPGFSYTRHHKRVTQLVQHHRCMSLLDYGCGKGLQWTEKQLHRKWGFEPHLYDPAVLQHDQLPHKKFDAIISTDVLEHVPMAELPGMIYWMFLHARKFIYLGIYNEPALAKLPNGENAHCTLMHHEQWESLIRHHKTHDIPVYLNTYPTDEKSTVI